MTGPTRTPRTLRSEWQSFLESVIDTSATPEDVQMLRRVFYAGALAYSTVQGCLFSEKPSAAIAGQIALEAELTQFSGDVAAERS